jgi:hypothetical protein
MKVLRLGTNLWPRPTASPTMRAMRTMSETRMTMQIRLGKPHHLGPGEISLAVVALSAGVSPTSLSEAGVANGLALRLNLRLKYE